jgi:hypothetical protein
MIDAVVHAREPAAEAGKPNGKHLPLAPTGPAEAAADGPKTKFCHACWSGEYPIEFTQHPRVRQMRLLDL